MTAYLKHGLGDSQGEYHDLMKPLTPRSERQRATYGSMLSSLQESPGLCSRTRKCVRRDRHDGQCWPT